MKRFQEIKEKDVRRPDRIRRERSVQLTEEDRTLMLMIQVQIQMQMLRLED
jgi:hypothetical protein